MVIPVACRSHPVSSGPYVETGNERDRALICAIASGDRAAFEEIHSRYSGRIRAFALKRTRRRDLAEELTCETLTTIWLSAARFRHASKVSTWIFGIARILSLRALRRLGSAATTATDAHVEEFHNPWSKTSYANGWMRRSHSCPRSSARRWSYAIARATRANKLPTVLVAL